MKMDKLTDYQKEQIEKIYQAYLDKIGKLRDEQHLIITNYIKAVENKKLAKIRTSLT